MIWVRRVGRILTMKKMKFEGIEIPCCIYNTRALSFHSGDNKVIPRWESSTGIADIQMIGWMVG